MAESIRDEGISPEHDRVDDGEIRVFFEDEDEGSIILETAESEMDSFALLEGRYHYEKLHLKDGLMLTPTAFTGNLARVAFAESLEVIIQFGGRSLLQSAQYRDDLQFGELVRPISSPSEMNTYLTKVNNDERERAPDFEVELRKILDRQDDLWVRLEAGYNPDKHLVGKIIVARLSFLMTVEGVVGIAPGILDIDGNRCVIPEQLILNEHWLYSEVYSDDEIE